MLKIAICDDDTGDRERIAEDLRVYAAAHQEHSTAVELARLGYKFEKL